MLYHLIVIIAAVIAGVWGWKRGFARNVPSLIGLAFGILSSRLLAPGFENILWGAFPAIHGKVQQTFVYDTTSTTVIFFSVYFIFASVTRFVGKILYSKDHTVLDNIGGSIFCIFKYIFFISILFNVMVALNRDSGLLKFVKHDDGNIVEEVILLSPALLGGEDAEDLSHKIQLEEAKKIS